MSFHCALTMKVSTSFAPHGPAQNVFRIENHFPFSCQECLSKTPLRCAGSNRAPTQDPLKYQNHDSTHLCFSRCGYSCSFSCQECFSAPSARCADPVPYALQHKASNQRSLEAAIDAAAKFLNAAAKPVLIAGKMAHGFLNFHGNKVNFYTSLILDALY
jgi:hypothetical protein